MKRKAEPAELDANGHVIAPKVLRVMEVSEQQPPQRDPAWHLKRHNFLTASELASSIKLTAHEIALRDAGIIEMELKKKVGQVVPAYTPAPALLRQKCAPPASGSRQFSIQMEWGVMLEPVVNALQEAFTGMIIHPINLIPHPTIDFLAASPDGITSDGKMLEIKCPHTRKPSGKPKLQYWIQMQSQMECCDMESCEFLDVAIKEYNDREHYLADKFYGEDGEFVYARSEAGRPKGVLIERRTWSKPHGQEVFEEDISRKYYYPPVLTFENQQQEDKWLQDWAAEIYAEVAQDPIRQLNVLTGQQEKYVLRYWYVEEWNAATIQRDRVWFQSRLPDFQAFWSLVLKCRAEGNIPDNALESLQETEPEVSRAPSRATSRAKKVNPIEVDGCQFVDDGDY